MDGHVAIIRNGDRGGTDVWVYGQTQDTLQWMEGWHTPNPISSWWSAPSRDWHLIGYKLIDPETKVVAKAFFWDLTGYYYVGPDGSKQKHTHARLMPTGNSKGKGPPLFEKIEDEPNAGSRRSRKRAGKGPPLFEKTEDEPIAGSQRSRKRMHPTPPNDPPPPDRCPDRSSAIGRVPKDWEGAIEAHPMEDIAEQPKHCAIGARPKNLDP